MSKLCTRFFGEKTPQKQMTKTPATQAPCQSMGENNHGSFNELVEPVTRLKHQNVRCSTVPAGHVTGVVPQLVVTCEPTPSRPEHKTTRTSALSFCSHPDEESVCSDSGIGGSPAPSLFYRKLSNSSSAVLSPASSFEEYDEDFSEHCPTVTHNSQTDISSNTKVSNILSNSFSL